MKRKKRMKLPIPTLPPDVCVEILSRRSIKPIARFRCVSKLWGSLIDDPHFTLTHLINCLKKQEKSRLLVIEPPEMVDAKNFCTIRRGDTFRKISQDGLNVRWYEHYQVVGYINGVVCMEKYNKEKIQFCGSFLWNPSIRKLVELPLPELANIGTKKVDVAFAFGFDVIRNDYKVIASLHAKNKFHIPRFVEIYTLNKRSWRCISIENAPCLWSKDGPKAFLDRVTYWVGDNLLKSGSLKGKYSHFVSFDASNDEFNYIELPDCENIEWERERFSVVLRQALTLMEVFWTRSNIWVMEVSGMTKSWTKRYSINLELYDRFSHLKTNGEVLFTKERGVKSYNLESQETKLLAKSYSLTPVFIDIYRESLVLLNENHEKPLRNI